MPKVRSKVTRVARPSAKVSADAPTTRVPVRHEWATAIGAFGADADNARLQAEGVAHRDEAARAAAAADGHKHHVDVLQGLEQLERIGADAAR